MATVVRPTSRLTFLCQLLVAMLVSVAIGTLLVAVPYFSRARFAAGGAAVGWMGGLYQGAYALSVLLVRNLLDRFDLRNLNRIGCLTCTVVLAAMPFTTSAVGLTVCMALFGIGTMFIWPPLMGWLARGAEGAELNRRLGRYNAAWSMGLIAGPVLGGWLYMQNPTWPFFAAAGMLALCVGALLLAEPAPPAAAGPRVELDAPADTLPSAAEEATVRPDELTRFRRMARVGLVTSYVAMGILRYQLPNLAQEWGIDAEHFGPISMTLSASLALGFFVLGLTPAWHLRRWPMWVCQAAIVAGLLLIFFGQGSLVLFIASALVGLGNSLLYAAHLYYGVTGGRDRARLMAFHELLLSAGFLTGAIGGGWLADFSLRAPYSICAALMAGGLILLFVFGGWQAPRPNTNIARPTTLTTAERNKDAGQTANRRTAS